MIRVAPRAGELLRLEEIARSLAQSQDLKEVKAIRDKAEAARHYAQSASLGLQIQNRAAELKLRAERKAGQLLSELVYRGGNRRSNSHDGSLKLSDLGIGYNQSSRWQKEAAVPERIFEEYLAAANKMGRDITAQSLLRLGRSWLKKQSANCNRNDDASSKKAGRTKKSFTRPTPSEPVNGETGPLVENVAELKNHYGLLWSILSPYCRGEAVALKLSERRMVERLLSDSQELMTQIEQLISGLAGSRSTRNGSSHIVLDES